VIISAEGRKPFTLAHEIVHVLTQDGHADDATNLMLGGTSALHQSIMDTKRLTNEQENIIYTETNILKPYE